MRLCLAEYGPCCGVLKPVEDGDALKPVDAGADGGALKPARLAFSTFY